MNKIFGIGAIVGGLTMGLNTILSFPALAQTVSISVSPMVTIQPIKGAQSRSSFSVTNSSTIPIRTRIYAQDFDYDRSEGYTKTETHSNSASPYLQFSPKELVIAPGVTREVRVSITIPPSQPDREYRVAVFTEDLTEREITSTKTQVVTIIRPQIASIFYISKGNLTPELSAIGAIWDPKNKKPRLLLKNKGKASAYPDVEWKLSQGNKEVAGSTIFGVVLQAERERLSDINTFSETPLQPGQYTLAGEVNSKDGKKIPFSFSLTVPN
jgi:hypothetical protein